MTITEKYRYAFLFCFFLLAKMLNAQTNKIAGKYNIYTGNTHAHTSYTWSHGEQIEKNNCKGIAVFDKDSTDDAIDTWKAGYVKIEACPAIIIIKSSQYPGPGLSLKAGWQKYQGDPAVHYKVAKENSYDFYVTTDHSQEYIFNPPDSLNKAWISTAKSAEAATNKDFVAIRGYEHSENDGPNGQGHINVINTATYLNALKPGIDLKYLYNWLKTVKPNGEGPVVASFNHPGPEQYNNWAYRDDSITNIITLLEMINSNNKIHYEGFINALDKGWKVSPVCGNDNHGLTGIANHTSRTFVLAENKTKAAILDAMKNRRTYASLEKNIQCSYTVNDNIMGSTIPSAKTYRFKININDPDINDASDKITKLDIITDSGKIAKTYTTKGEYTVTWNVSLPDEGSTYYFVRVWNAVGGDAKNADAKKPVAWLAPVWINR